MEKDNKKIKDMGLGELSKRLAVPKHSPPVTNNSPNRIKEMGDLLSDNPDEDYKKYLIWKKNYDQQFGNSSMEEELRNANVSRQAPTGGSGIIKAIKPKEQTEEDKQKVRDYAKSLYAKPQPKPKKALRLPTQDVFKVALLAALNEEFKTEIVWHNYMVSACKKATEWVFSVVNGDMMFRGLLLLGACGTGKTNITKALKKACDYFSNHDDYDWSFTFNIASTKDIANEAKAGINVVDKYRMGVWCFDDVGFEPTAKSYGNEIDAFEDILDRIYRTESKPILVSTNLIPERGENNLVIGGSIEERYGTRVADRCNEIFLTAYLGQKSYRGHGK